MHNEEDRFSDYLLSIAMEQITAVLTNRKSEIEAHIDIDQITGISDDDRMRLHNVVCNGVRTLPLFGKKPNTNE